MAFSDNVAHVTSLAPGERAHFWYIFYAAVADYAFIALTTAVLIYGTALRAAAYPRPACRLFAPSGRPAGGAGRQAQASSVRAFVASRARSGRPPFSASENIDSIAKNFLEATLQDLLAALDLGVACCGTCLRASAMITWRLRWRL